MMLTDNYRQWTYRSSLFSLSSVRFCGHL